MVGDENQSIYRFRNADLEVFRSERRRALDADDRDVLPLRGNFRSLPAVLGAVNEVGRTLLDGLRRADRGRGGTRRGRARSSSCSPSTRAGERTRAAGTPRGSSSSRRRAARRPGSSPRPASSPSGCAQLVDAGEAERGEIVVLLRAFTHVDAYEEALRRAGLRPFVVGGRGYWTQQQVEDLIRLLGVVSNPLDDEYLFGALAWFACGVSPDALWLLRRAARDDEGRAPPRLARAARRASATATSPGEWQPEWLEGIPAEDGARLERFCRIARRHCAPRRRCSALERADRADDERLRLRPRPDRPRRRRRADGERAQADAPRARVRAQRGPRPRRLPRPGRGEQPPRRARGDGGGPGRGPRRRPGDDRARGQGARVPGRRGARPRPRPRRRPPAQRRR